MDPETRVVRVPLVSGTRMPLPLPFKRSTQGIGETTST